MQRLQEASAFVRKRKAEKIAFAPPFLLRHEQPFLKPHTINILQGKSGTHKSRLAETICGVMLSRNSLQRTLGLRRQLQPGEQIAVCFVDTERNLKDQFPRAVQNVLEIAGYDCQDNPPNFHYTSLVETKREERFDALEEWLRYLRGNHPEEHLFVVLDVVTDCVGSFNDAAESMKLIDLLNVFINRYDATFLCPIHENPGGEKARGHLGTELMNKASLVLQISFELNSKNKPTDIIRVSHLKCRDMKRPKDFHLKCCEETRQLQEAYPEEVAQMQQERQQKATSAEVLEVLGSYSIGQELRRKELFAKLSQVMDCNQKTVEKRLQTLLEQETEFTDAQSRPCQLQRTKVGREVIYSLAPLPDDQAPTSAQPEEDDVPF